MAQQVKYTWDSGSTAHAARILHCTWSCRSMPAVADSKEYSVIDLFVEVKGHSSITETSEHISRDKHPKLWDLFHAILGNQPETANFAVRVKVLLPPFDGYFVQENIIQNRFTDSEIVSAVLSFASWDAKTRAVPPHTLTSKGLADVVASGAAALVGRKTQPSGSASECREIENELRCRLQLQWWQHELPPMRRLALVMVGRTWRFYGPVYEAAKANRIELVIIDEPDHWLNEPCNSKLREHFLPMSLNNDDGQLPTRIAEVVRNSGLVLDGLTTHHDHGIASVAEAAAALGLPTQPTSSYLLCRDKHATHRLRTEKLLCKLVTTEEQASALADDPNVQYPLVVKPRGGFHSEGVTKITEPCQILPAVTNILSELHDFAVVETYIGGPEIDVNLVLCDGRLLFCEIADNWPCQGDDDTADPSGGLQPRGNFSETGTASPSALPQEELLMAQASAFKAVMAAGFSTGVFHVEGRVTNSAMRYERVEGQVDLRAALQAHHQNAAFVLIEINARPPGLPVSLAAKRNFGVDYYEQLMLMALKDHERMCILARPFAFPGLRGAQYWSHTQFPLVVYGGAFDGSAWRSMIASHPQAFQHVSAFDCLWEDGQEMPDPMTGRSRALAYLVMYARDSRPRLSEIVADVQRQLQPILAAGLIRMAKTRARIDSASSMEM
ncbi:hypothetical protein LTR15_003604 [Elasticomyces elasticus]|nr:hypothetical protein LTR15_003604 [Elasticomyces elasticus]